VAYESFGFAEHYRYGEQDGQISGAQMYLGNAYIMLESTRGRQTPAQLGFGTQYVTLFVDSIDAHFEKSKTEGARIVEELHETIYGERQYVAEDLEGHRWLFSQHARDVAPADWGARLVKA
jgi:uncharacterized glyoxalase superfamily protein PhnB